MHLKIVIILYDLFHILNSNKDSISIVIPSIQPKSDLKLLKIINQNKFL